MHTPTTGAASFCWRHNKQTEKPSFTLKVLRELMAVLGMAQGICPDLVDLSLFFETQPLGDLFAIVFSLIKSVLALMKSASEVLSRLYEGSMAVVRDVFGC